MDQCSSIDVVACESSACTDLFILRSEFVTSAVMCMIQQRSYLYSRNLHEKEIIESAIEGFNS
jgi:hypothetical protein